MVEQPNRNPAQRFWRWFKGQIIEDVPKDIAICEYDCPKEQCRENEWATCERRLSAAAGELKPEHPPVDRRKKPGAER
jgi:hypothetical protein